MHLIYIIVDNEQLPLYVGKTKDLKKRIISHQGTMRSKCTLPIYNKLRKLIREGRKFDFLIVEDNLTDETVDDRERYHIARLRSIGYKLCNLADGGEGGKGMTSEMQKKAGLKRRGQKRSLESRKRMSEARIGMKFSDEHKKNLSKARKQRITKDSTREKIRITSTGRVNIKSYILTDPQGLEHETQFGLTDFCRKNNLCAPNLVKVLKGQRKNHKGWIIRRK